jgi:uncharacterized iron-regulated membrane protein
MDIVATAFRHRVPSARKIWLQVHLWLGLSAGLVLALIGLTGSVLVLNDQLLTIEVGHIFDVAGPIPPHPAVDQWIANAHRAYGNFDLDSVVGPGFGLAGGNAAMLGAIGPGHTHWLITIDPNSGLPLGNYIWEDRFTTFVLQLHAGLGASGRWLSWGRETLAWLGVVMLVSMATGLYLWWPRNRNWYTAFTLKRGARGRRRLLDLHNLFAVYLYVPLLIIAVTGVYFLRPDWIDPAISLVSVERTPDPGALARASKPGSCPARTTPGQAAALALARYPSSRLAAVIVPGTQNQPLVVQLAPPDNLGFKGQTQVFIDPECPMILTALDGDAAVAAEAFKAIVHPLHFNLMLGRFGQAIVFLAGLLLPLSWVTGLLLWLDKSKNRKRSA